MRRSRQAPQFTHFGSIPFIRPQYRQELSELQAKITKIFSQKGLEKTLKPNNPNLFHLTLSMLTLPHSSTRQKLTTTIQANTPILSTLLTHIHTQKIKYFTFKQKSPTQTPTISVIYLDIKKDKQYEKLTKLIDFYVRLLLKEQIIYNQELKDMHIYYDHHRNLFCNQQPHVTLFRCQGLSLGGDVEECLREIQGLYEGRVLECDFIDISTRFQYDQTKFYNPLCRVHLNTNPNNKEQSQSQQKQQPIKTQPPNQNQPKKEQQPSDQK